MFEKMGRQKNHVCKKAAIKKDIHMHEWYIGNIPMNNSYRT